jgi:chorismate dehydratase
VLALKQPRIGCVKYLNARPLIYGWPGALELDHPSALCRKLAHGELDLALVSSVEYLRRPEYRIVDGISISAFGPVYSVIVAHEREISEISEIEVDPASETSVVLLRCLLAARGLNARLVTAAGIDARSALLRIGDQAIRFRYMHPEYRFWDLGEEWRNITGLPFVFALWLVRAEEATADEIAQRLRNLRDQNLARLDEVIATQDEFAAEFCRQYFRDHLRFGFGSREKDGLREFHRRCLACGIDLAPPFTLNVV